MSRIWDFAYSDHVVRRYGFVVGAKVNDKLVPIFDIAEKMIVIRDEQNIILPPEDSWIFFYFRPVNPHGDYSNYPPSPTIIVEMFNRLRQAHSTHTVGIHYYQQYFNGPWVDVSRIWDYADSDHVTIKSGFVIGAEVGDKLRPIFDIAKQMIVIRVHDRKNIVLSPEEAAILPYHLPIMLSPLCMAFL